MGGRSARAIRFGVFEVDLQAGELRKNGLKIRIQEQPLQILAVLIERPGDVVTREDLRQRLWPTDTFVDFDHSLNTAVNKLREALGDSADSPRYVETLPRRGYRFVAPLELLGEDLAEPAPGQPEPPPTRTRRLLPWERIAFIAGLAVAVGIIVTMWLSRRGTVSEAPVQRFTFAPEGGATTPVISPDGKHIAYLSGSGDDARAMVQDLDRFAPREIPGSEGAKEYIFWSQDSGHIGFAAGGRLWKAPTPGGDPAAICQLPGEYLGGAWSPDGLSIVFSVSHKGLYEVPARGGTPKLIVPVDMNRWGDHFELPWFLPASGGGRVFLYTAQTRERTHVTVLHSLGSGEQRIVAPNGLGVFSPTGHLVYWNRSLLWALPFSSNTKKVTGDAFPIAGTAVFTYASVSLDGTLVYLESGD
ncbi:MAG TPA: winged helix-turn-helix domain-containing protein, partial [Bryobacteraceae bacterium]|nr:winged helix-turn-helix domain-containing protein [Bryobacteraceae bacterium]